MPRKSVRWLWAKRRPRSLSDRAKPKIRTECETLSPTSGFSVWLRLLNLFFFSTYSILVPLAIHNLFNKLFFLFFFLFLFYFMHKKIDECDARLRSAALRTIHWIGPMITQWLGELFEYFAILIVLIIVLKIFFLFPLNIWGRSIFRRGILRGGILLRCLPVGVKRAKSSNIVICWSKYFHRANISTQ